MSMSSPSIPRVSASVVVLCPNTKPNFSGFSVLMVQRPLKAGEEGQGITTVFPGGMFEKEDATMQYCAVRELFEETGMLLAFKKHDTPSEQYGFSDRVDLSESEVKSLRPLGFQTVLKKLGLQPSITNFQPWSNWITPLGVKRRYDTKFYITAVSDKGCTLPDNSEIDRIVWFEPKQALQLARDRKIFLAVPQFYILNQLANINSVESVLKCSDGRSFTAILPELKFYRDGVWNLLLPGDSSFGAGKVLSRKGKKHRLVQDERSKAEAKALTWIIQKTESNL